jgi:hypothetical protein
MRKPRTYEELGLLLSYISVLGIWFAIPSLSLLLNRDKRWPIALIILSTLLISLLIAYITQWKVLFPRTAVEQISH